MRTSQAVLQRPIGWRGLFLVLLALVWTSGADEPRPKAEAKLPWQRRLQGNDAKQAEKLEKRLEEAAVAGHIAEALTAAKELLAVGRSPANADLDPADLAAWTIVCATILNLDETISKE